MKVETFLEGKAKGLLGYDMIVDSGGRSRKMLFVVDLIGSSEMWL